MSEVLVIENLIHLKDGVVCMIEVLFIESLIHLKDGVAVFDRN